MKKQVKSDTPPASVPANRPEAGISRKPVHTNPMQSGQLPIQLSLFPEVGADTMPVVRLRINGRIEVIDGMNRILGLLELAEPATAEEA